ncbi:MAG: hypothetical protein QOF56_1946 [Acidobacteriaceae bacterium]|nr:hypothetical protein [Acidobacteriaceae bacterium]
MSAYALTSLAKANIFEIWSYIANDSEENRRSRGMADLRGLYLCC